jgi:lipopolysaccharide export system permease protein
VIAVVIDISEKTDDFVKAGLSASRGLYKVLSRVYTLHRCLAFPLFVFIALFFLLQKWQGAAK